MNLKKHAIGMAAAVFAIAGALLIPSIASADVQPSQVPAGLKDAIRGAVEQRGHDYAGLCREIDQSQHVGESCAFVLELTEFDATVSFGPVLSDEIQTLRFDNRNQNRVWVESTAQPPLGEVPQALRDAIKKTVEARGQTYAGLCKEIPDQSQHIGQWCAFVDSVRSEDADVTFGPVLSDELYSARFVKSGDTWALATGSGNPGVPLPPNTGTGSMEGESKPTDWLVVVLGALVLVASGGVVAAVERKS
jgi:hypothetical protein